MYDPLRFPSEMQNKKQYGCSPHKIFAMFVTRLYENGMRSADVYAKFW